MAAQDCIEENINQFLKIGGAYLRPGVNKSEQKDRKENGEWFGSRVDVYLDEIHQMERSQFNKYERL